MALYANTLKNLIKENLKEATTAEDALKIFGDTISDYILDNAVFSFSWSATQTIHPYNPDPVTTASGKFISLLITITPSGATNATDANIFLKNRIVAGMQNASYNITSSGFTTSSGSMSTAPTLNSLNLSPSGETNQDDALLDRCTKIINWVKQLKPTAHCSGTRIAGSITYAGAGTVTNIS
jgi:hypothetical protein